MLSSDRNFVEESVGNKLNNNNRWPAHSAGLLFDISLIHLQASRKIKFRRLHGNLNTDRHPPLRLEPMQLAVAKIRSLLQLRRGHQFARHLLPFCGLLESGQSLSVNKPRGQARSGGTPILSQHL